MTDEKWEQLVDIAQKNFQHVKLRREDLVMETPDGPQNQGTQDILEFENPGGRFQVVRENRPMVLEKKTLYTHRPGDTAHTEYKLSQTEFSHKIRVYKEQGFDDWEEITLDKLGF
jgi:hypothetical protein